MSRCYTDESTEISAHLGLQLSDPDDSIDNLRKVLPFGRLFGPAGALVEVVVYLPYEDRQLTQERLSLRHQLAADRRPLYQLLVPLELPQQL